MWTTWYLCLIWWTGLHLSFPNKQVHTTSSKPAAGPVGCPLRAAASPLPLGAYHQCRPSVIYPISQTAPPNGRFVYLGKCMCVRICVSRSICCFCFWPADRLIEIPSKNSLLCGCCCLNCLIWVCWGETTEIEERRSNNRSKGDTRHATGLTAAAGLTPNTPQQPWFTLENLSSRREL